MGSGELPDAKGNLGKRLGIVAKSGGRRYARDSRGRFASVGATARGGRLAKAGGKRATVTAKATGGGKGTIAKPRGLKPGTLKPKSQGTAVSAPTKAAQGKSQQTAAKPRKKTDQEALWQASRIIGKAYQKAAKVDVNKVGLSEGLRQARRSNSRVARVSQALNRRGLLQEYQRLTAPADPIRLRPAGPGIKPPRRRR